MKTTSEYIAILHKYMAENAHKYGIVRMGIFGSVARGEQTENSDVDVFISLQEPDFFVMEQIKEELEHLLHHPIDLINFRESLRPSLKKNILKDAIYI